MIRVLHCADLHLTADPADRDYSLAVLDEITGLAKKRGAAYLLFAGDTFNTFGDAEALRAEFRDRIEPLRGTCEVFLLAGNHEDLGRGKRKLVNFDLGLAPENCVEFDGAPFRLIRRGGVEILAIPHQHDYRNYTEWAVPAKQEAVRIALAHGIVAGMTYAGEDDESAEKAAVMDADLFQRYGADYAALGHIHAARSLRQGSTDIVYPGSARVWRKNEFGPRRVRLLEIGGGIRGSEIELASAGSFRALELFVGFEGGVEALPPEAESWGPRDYVGLRFFGVLENEGAAVKNIEAVENALRKRVRRLESERDLSVIGGVSAQPIARKFLETWKAMEPREADPEARGAWLRAREMGLLRIKALLEDRS